MNELQLKALLAGIAWGIWPLFMAKSGVSGNISSTVFSIVVVIGVLPFALSNMGGSLAAANWTMVVVAGLISAGGLLLFNSMLASSTHHNVGALIVVMTLAQTAVPAFYQVVSDGRLSVARGIGFVAAFVAAVLLIK